MKNVGRNLPKKEAVEKVNGQAIYVEDIKLKGALWGQTIRSTIAHGKIKKITFDPVIPWNEFVIVDYKDIPGKNQVALIEYDQPFLVEEIIQHAEEPILLIAHENREMIIKAQKYINIEYEIYKPLLNIDESGHVQKSFHIENGDLKLGHRESFMIHEGVYRVPHQEHIYIENNGMLGWVTDDGVVTVQGSLQCPYYVVKALKYLFDLPEEKIRVMQTVTGGGFGGKEEYPSLLAGHVALLALKAKRPVRMIYDRAEDIAATTKRHPGLTKVKLGCDEKGKLTFVDIEFVLDGGAYVTLSPVVLSRGTLHAGGAYASPSVRIISRSIKTNTPPNGAYRGFGAPQSLFGIECAVTELAHKMKMDPAQFRKLNAYKIGDVMPTGQVLGMSVSTDKVLVRTLKISDYKKKRKMYDAFNKKSETQGMNLRKGIGVSLILHGAGFTGSGEVYLNSKAGVELGKDGRIRVLSGSTEIGQGTNTVFSQICSDTLGLGYEDIDVVVPDTHVVPDSGPTVASRTCMVVGGLVHKAALELKQKLEELNSSPFFKPSGAKVNFKKTIQKLYEKYGPLTCYSVYEKPTHVQWDDKTYKGDAYAVYAWAAVVADVEVDLLTFEVKLKKLYSSVDVGKAIHPLLTEGQIEGGMLQAVGYALTEELVWKDGRIQNNSLTNYIIPTSMDTPDIIVNLVENPYKYGPYGAKGVGELPMDGPAPAIVGAIFHATGKFIAEIPVTPERLLKYTSNQKLGMPNEI
ncbi:MAG: xanthine dehydrogenase family protein molybdopterin-binding subunit [Oligoflexia bacterium]|nr:xanthine dehydrogenase family protein molybdopterin-binding subunit [Oligoflexia bacterium]